MRLTKRQTAAAVLAALVVVPYLGYVILGQMPFIQDARGMGALGVTLAACAYALVLDAFHPRWLGVVAALVTLGLGVTAAVLETGPVATGFLAAFVVAMLVTLAAAFRPKTPA